MQCYNIPRVHRVIILSPPMKVVDECEALRRAADAPMDEIEQLFAAHEATAAAMALLSKAELEDACALRGVDSKGPKGRGVALEELRERLLAHFAGASTRAVCHSVGICFL